MTLSLLPVWLIDFSGCILMIVLSLLCLQSAYKIFSQARDNALANHLIWFCLAIFAFSLSRSLGHLVSHVLYFAGHAQWWETISPLSGSINTITFVIIASVTLFFDRMQIIMNRMTRDRENIEKISRELFNLNHDRETIASARTRVQMALRVAHEIRNPVMVIGAMLRRIVEKTPEYAGQTEPLKKIIAEAERLESLVKRFEEVRPGLEKIITGLDLNRIMDEALEIIRGTAVEKNITLIFKPAPVHLNFQGNRQLIRIAVLQIIRNAIDVCGPGDTIRLTTELGDGAVIGKIIDSGPGIPREMMEHIFEPFYSTAKGKTGLGLAYVHQIVEEHKGRIKISSTKENGTVIEIILPTHLGELMNNAGIPAPVD